MLHVALANIRTYARRYIAVVLAVAIGTAFLAATLAVSSSTRATLKNSLGDSYKNADLVAFYDWQIDNEISSEETSDETSEESHELTFEQLNDLRAMPEIQTAYGIAVTYSELRTGDNGYGVLVQPVSAEQKLGGMELLEGRAPLNSDELILDDDHAEKMGVSVGDTVALNDPESNVRNMKIVGIQKTSTNPQYASYGIVGMEETAWKKFAGESNMLDAIVVNAEGSVSAAQQTMQEYFTSKKMPAIAVLTADEKVMKDVSSMTDGTDHLTVLLLVFALVALVVTGLVVVNTFSVVVAQRTRELALLRTLGAKRKQISNSVLLEALVIGVIASVIGVALAIALLAGLIQLVHVFVPAMSFATLAVNPVGIIVPIVVGILMTVIAASVPARRAMMLAPLAALRPFDAASVKNRAGKIRIVFGALLALAGTALLIFGAINGNLLVAFGGGLLSFPGILMLASLFVPASVFGIGKVLAGRSVAGRLAALNAVRNPGRTTATATALLIGVTLVSMIMVGGQTAKASLNNSIAAEFPVDLMVDMYDKAPDEAKAQKLSQEIGNLDGVSESAPFLVQTVTDDSALADEEYGYTVLAIDPADLSRVALDPSIIPADGEITLTRDNIAEGQTTVEIGGKTLKIKSTKASVYSGFITTNTLKDLKVLKNDWAQAYSGVVVKVDPKLSNSGITELIKEVADAANVESYMVDGGVVMKAMFSQIIDVLLTIVSALLAVAVLIALIGVANTLSLSVLERTRENSLLRALGLKKKQLRSMLAVEAVLIGGVASLLGLVLGTIYGLLGARSALGSMGNMTYEIPWLYLGLVLLVSIAAALLASVTPGRRAAKLSPVEGLAAE